MRNASTLILLPHTEFTSAIQLIIEVIFLDDLQATFLQAIFSPVTIPPYDCVIWWDRLVIIHLECLLDLPASPETGLIYLVEGLPSG